MKKTVENMEQVLNKMVSLSGLNVKESDKMLKTLSNTYQTFINELRRAKKGEMNEYYYVEELEKQLNFLNRLTEKFDHAVIPELLSEEKYIKLNNLVTTNDKIKQSSLSVKELLIHSLYEQHRKKIGVISKYKSNAIEFLDELVSKCGEEIIERNGESLSTVIKTKSYSFYAYGYTDRLRGMSLDKVYADKSLDLEAINNIILITKNKSEPELF